MFKDNELLFASAWSPTATGDNISTNTLDTGPLGLPTGSGGGGGTNAGRDLGVGSEMWMEILVTAAATSGGSATVNFQLVTDTTAAISTVNVLVSSGAITVATLIAGYIYRVQLPASASYKRYIAANANIAVAVLTAGTFEAKLLKNIQAADNYYAGFTVA